MASIFPFDSLPLSGEATRLFEGSKHDAPVSFFLVDAAPGDGPRLHVHPYKEVFIVQDGTAEFRVGDDVVTVGGGAVVVAPANVAHVFSNTGSNRLRMVNVHPMGEIVTEWLD